MKGKMKNRLALLSVLLVAGLLMAGIGIALGAGNLLKLSGKQVSASVMTNEDGMDVVTIREDGKVVNELILLESYKGYTIETSDGKIVIGKMPKDKMTEEEMEKHQAEAEAEKNEFLEIAKKDSEVQELIDGKAYEVVGMSTSGTAKGETETAILILEIEGKYYEVTIDLNSETVKSIEEQSSAVTENYTGHNLLMDQTDQ
jgi:hypothetical protein